MQKPHMLHKENQTEWRFIGIWADMLNFDVSSYLKKYTIESCLILFHDYDTTIQILQENLRLRNLYNKYRTLFIQSNSKDLKEKIEQIDLDIQNNIGKIFEQKSLCIYNLENDTIISISKP